MAGSCAVGASTAVCFLSATHSKQKHAFKMSQSKDYPRKSRGGGDDDDFGGFDDMFPKPNTDF